MASPADEDDAAVAVLEVPLDQAHLRLAHERRHVRVGGSPVDLVLVPNWTSLPSRMTAIRSDSVIASSWSWVTNTLVVPGAGGGA